MNTHTHTRKGSAHTHTHKEKQRTHTQIQGKAASTHTRKGSEHRPMRSTTGSSMAIDVESEEDEDDHWCVLTPGLKLNIPP